jgi:hypothetical protein
MEPALAAVVKDGALAVLLMLNMFYLGKKIDRLTEAVYRQGRKPRKRKGVDL